MIYLGIDFGTSNSSIAFFDDERKMLEVVSPAIDPKNLPGGRVYPSIVAFDREGNMIAAGWYAHSYGQAFPKLVVDQVKRWIGMPYTEIIGNIKLENLGYKIIEKDRNVLVKVGNKTHTPEEIVAYLLKYMVEDGKAYLKDKDIDLSAEKVTVIVTHPAYYKQNQVEAIRDAVSKMKEQIRGIDFEHIKLIPEPIASICAAMYYGKLSKKDKYVMVIDEGAGTLDTMLVDMEQVNIGKEEKIEAIGITIGGHDMLGGADMDNNIMEWVLDELKRDKNINRDEIKNINKQTLRREAESAKIDISEGRTKVAQIRVPSFSKLVELTESQLNTLVSPVIMDCKETIVKSLNEIEKKYDEKNKRNIRREDISKVIFVGGPTRMKLFKNMGNEILKVEIVDINPMECVAIGAAVSPAVHYKIPADRTYGLLKKEDGKDKFIALVQKDTPLPKGTIIEWKVEAFQTEIPIEVAQVIEEQNVAENKKEIVCLKMGKYECSVPPHGKTYFIVFRIDDERKVEVKVTGLESKAEEYLKGTVKEESGDLLRVRFRREKGTCLVEEYIEPPPPPVLMFFLNNAPGLASKLKTAHDILEKSKRLIKFDIEDSKFKELSPIETYVENLLEKIREDINSKLKEIDIEADIIPDAAKTEIKRFIKDLLHSDDYINLLKNADLLERKMNDITPYILYDKYKIIDLLEKISYRETEALTKMQQLRDNLSPQDIKEIESLLDELDKIKEFLENKSDIVADSQEGDIYRKGKNKEQELKSIIEQKLVQDR